MTSQCTQRLDSSMSPISPEDPSLIHTRALKRLCPACGAILSSLLPRGSCRRIIRQSSDTAAACGNEFLAALWPSRLTYSSQLAEFYEALSHCIPLAATLIHGGGDAQLTSCRPGGSPQTSQPNATFSMKTPTPPWCRGTRYSAGLYLRMRPTQ
jgi:hypothetical protein